jgi:glyoxylase-like metal-dependent hydrolase (beta-lactamase superfamily II)
MKLTPLITEVWHMDGGVAFGVVPKSIWSKYHVTDTDNLISIVNRLLLVESGERLILVDTGFGHKRDDKYYQYKYITRRVPLSEAIEKAGYQPTQVTDVILTHLHDDHAGGAVTLENEKAELVCPEATHWISQQQWEWALNPNPREVASYFTDNLLPIRESGKLKLVHGPGMLWPGVEVLMVHGHTGGQMVPLFHTDQGIVAFMADFIPSRTHLPISYLASVDIQPLLALQEKTQYLSRALAENHLLVFEHDQDTEACFLEQGERGVKAGLSTSLLERMTGHS